MTKPEGGRRGPGWARARFWCGLVSGVHDPDGRAVELYQAGEGPR
jgi:hypothetical protein